MGKGVGGGERTPPPPLRQERRSTVDKLQWNWLVLFIPVFPLIFQIIFIDFDHVLNYVEINISITITYVVTSPEPPSQTGPDPGCNQFRRGQALCTEAIRTTSANPIRLVVIAPLRPGYYLVLNHSSRRVRSGPWIEV